MSNPLTLFDDLREMYLRYLDSPFDLRYPDLLSERRALLNTDGRLFRCFRQAAYRTHTKSRSLRNQLSTAMTLL